MKKCLYLILLFIYNNFAIAQINIDHTLLHNGNTREYTVHLPPNFDSSKHLPLVINMHGLSGSKGFQMIYTGFNAIADTGNFIVVYPQGLKATTFFGFTTQWDAYFGTGTMDLSFLDTLIDQMYYDYGINLSKVYSTGHSNGGFMSYRLACELSERVTAVASVGGAMAFEQENNCTLSHPMPILQIHGTNDSTVLFEGEPLFHFSIPDLIDFWKNKNNCTSDSIFTLIPDTSLADSSSAFIENFNQCNPNSQVVLYTVVDGGHSWPGTFDFPTLGTTCQDFNASSVIWNFFNQYELENPILPEDTNALTINAINNTVTGVYPNPFSNRLIITFDNEKRRNITLLNTLGQIIITENTSGKQIEINTKQLEKGVYIVLIDGENERLIVKK